MIGDQFGGAGFLFAKLRVLMNIPPPRDHLLLDLRCAGKGLLLQGTGLCRCLASKRQHCEAECADRRSKSGGFSSRHMGNIQAVFSLYQPIVGLGSDRGRLNLTIA
ncbi:hypothetical protein D3C80_1716850 [compost metagenome]